MKRVNLMGLLAGAALVGSAGVAAAADAYAPAYDWSGLYVGADVGYMAGTTDTSYDNTAPSGTSDINGIIGGGYIGANFQTNALVLGVEGDIEAANVDGSYNNTSGIGSSGSSDIDLMGSVRARMGYAMDRSLVYLTGGVAIADFDYGGGPAGGPCCGYSKTEVGWTVGAGFEQAITDNLLARIEYRYTDFGGSKGPVAPTYAGVTMKTDTQTHAVRLGLAWKF